MAAKLLISSFAGGGKTSLLKSLDVENTLVYSCDGKRFPFKMPHVTVNPTSTADVFIDSLEAAVEAFQDKYDKLPKTIAIDSISKILLDIEAYYVKTVSNYPYGKIGKDIAILMSYIENDLIGAGCNVVFVSHAIKDGDGYISLVTAGGAAGKKGGVFSECDEALFIEVRGKKRTIFHKNPEMLARSLLEDVPDKEPLGDFNLQDYIDKINKVDNENEEWSLV